MHEDTDLDTETDAPTDALDANEPEGQDDLGDAIEDPNLRYS